MSDDPRHGLLSLSHHIVKHARKWKLFHNERTTLLSHGEELQIIQHCIAQHNKQVTGLFHAEPNQSCQLLTAIKKYKIKSLLDIIEYQMNTEKKKPSMTESKETLIDGENSLESEANETTTEENGDAKVHVLANASIIDQSKAISKEENMVKELEKELELEGGFVSSILELFQENLKFSNHITLLSLYGTFVNKCWREDSKVAEELLPLGCETLSSDDPDMNKLESQIIRLLTGDFTHFADQPVANEIALPGSLENDVLSSTPKTPMISKTSPCANESTPRGSCDSAVKLTPTSSIFPNTPLNARQRLEAQKTFIENIFRCYLHLLVNSRCELALATIFNIPERELTHEAFTHLKHLATTSQLSMYQSLSTFLMRLRLGGQSYAPPSDQPLLAFVKGLGSLFDLLDKMQTVVEENPRPRSVCKRLLSIIKCNLSSCRSGKFPRSVVEGVAENILNLLSPVLETQERLEDGDGAEKSVSNGGSLNGQRSLAIIQHYLDISATNSSPVDHYMLSDVRFSQDTPTRFPSLLSKFRSPMPIEEEPTEQNDGSEKNENPSVGKPAEVKGQSFKASEALFLDGSKDDEIISTPFDLSALPIIPSKTIVHPGSFSRELIYQQKSSSGSGKQGKQVKNSNGNCLKVKPGTKRVKKDVYPTIGKENPSISKDMSPPPKKSSVTGGDKGPKKIADGSSDKTKVKGKSCRRKLMPQVKGQSKLTGFFKI